MAKSPRRRRCCSTKLRIVVALAAVMVATGAISVVSVVLRPGKIRFSITNAHNASSTAHDGKLQLNLTIAADNTSKRAGVHYSSVLVSLQYTSPVLDRRNYSIQADVLPKGPWSQPPRNTSIVSACAPMEPWKLDFPKPSRGGAATLIRVQVVAIARFKVGLAYTLPYQIRALCDPVDYFFNRSLASTSIIDCWDA